MIWTSPNYIPSPFPYLRPTIHCSFFTFHSKMPTLHWIGKEKVINHHLDVPYRVLEHQYGFDAATGKTETPTNSGNKIIHGDNLEALKSLLPEYEGKVKCIYIDPPYNTGNEGWVYNDNVNDPKIRKWLAQVVGKEGEDLSRHDKWLCMMYPRLVLLHRLLSEDGCIFVSIDEFEFDYLGLVLDEIFGRNNRVQVFSWKKTYGGGAKSKHVVNLHEYVYFYSKNFASLEDLSLPADASMLKYYKYSDEKFEERGPFRLQPLATTSMDDRPNLRYPITWKGEEIWPEKQWQWSRDRSELALRNNELVIEQNPKTNNWSINYKQYLKSNDGEERGRKIYSIIDGIYTQQGSNQLKSIFDGKVFNFPKPESLIRLFLELVTKNDSIVLDSFSGSGTTGHAVLSLNRQDKGNRKVLLIEMEDYADTVTAERLKRVMQGYGEGKNATEGTGGAFDYYELGPPLFLEDDNLNETVGSEKIRAYVWYTETRTAYQVLETQETYLLGKHDDTAYYFVYEANSLTCLDFNFLSSIATKAGSFVIYADNCLLTKEFMAQNNIVFKKIPRDISRF